jgi:hypothetical protein
MSVINVPAQLHLLIRGRTPLPIDGALVWGPSSPIEVRLVIADAVWLIARDLLTAGMDALTGEGDVQVFPHPAWSHLVQIDLTSDSGAASFTVPRQVLAGFLALTWTACPARNESRVIQAALATFNWLPPQLADDSEEAA